MNSYVTHLPSLGILEISGEDAPGFLHGQLTSDILTLEEGQARWSAWCHANGRVIATMLVTITAGHYYLVLASDMTETVCKRLKMFVLRAQVKVDNISDKYACLGASLDPAETGADPFNWDFSIVHAKLPMDPLRTLWITSRSEIPSLISGLASNGIRIVNDQRWLLNDIAAGIPWIQTATTDQALPQELGLERLQGLSYDKGCYPGQEVVARLHYRGRQKRQMCTAVISGVGPEIGSVVRNPAGSAAGFVLAAISKTNACHLLLLVDTELTPDRVLQLEHGVSFTCTLIDSQV